MGSLPSIRMRQTGASTQRWAQWRKRQSALVAMRYAGKCEGHRCTQKADELHHVFGRRHIIAEPLASHHTMCAALCRDCHRATHRGEKPITPILQLAALGRAAAWWRLPDIPIDGVRTIEAMLRSEGEWERLCKDAGR